MRSWVLASLLLAQSTPSPSPVEFWRDVLRDGQVLHPCATSASAWQDARRRLDAWAEAVEALKPTDSHEASVRGLHALLRHACFQLASEARTVPVPDSVESLQHWYNESGGHLWLESFLELPEYGNISRPLPHVITLPSIRRTLDLQSAPDHPLRDLLCPRGDAGCGAHTGGWRFRAENFFDDNPVGDGAQPPVAQGDDAAVAAECEVATKTEPADARYGAWRRCVEGRRPRHASLPLGRFEAPTSGWLIINGRRGHYQFCDATRAYDLATGHAFQHDSCSELALEPGGNVSLAATNDGRRQSVASGRLSSENLREAMWFIGLLPHVETGSFRAQGYPLPEGISRQIVVTHDGLETLDPISWSTAQTTLTWRWVRPGRPVVGGELTWPGSADPREDYAAQLLQVAEASFTGTCAPPQRPPSTVAHPPALLPDRWGPNADGYVEDFDAALSRANVAWAKLRGC